MSLFQTTFPQQQIIGYYSQKHLYSNLKSKQINRRVKFRTFLNDRAMLRSVLKFGTIYEINPFNFRRTENVSHYTGATNHNFLFLKNSKQLPRLGFAERSKRKGKDGIHERWCYKFVSLHRLVFLVRTVGISW